RHPNRTGGLHVERADGVLRVRVGESVFGSMPVANESAGSDCSTHIAFGSDRWSITSHGGRRREGDGDLAQMPVVTGLFTQLDLGDADAPHVSITTAVHSARPTSRQQVGWGLAIVASVLALLLVSSGGAQLGRWAAAKRTLTLAVRHVGIVDAVFMFVLLCW